MKRWSIAFLAVVVFLGTSIVIGYHLGVRRLQDRLVAALGPGSSVAELK